MKSLYCSLFMAALLPLVSFGQKNELKLDPAEHFIYFFDGTLLRAGDFEVKQGILTKKFFDNDGKKINLEGIKYYQDDSGYFGNEKLKTAFGQNFTEFLERTEPGTIDLFVKETSVGGTVNSSGHYRSGGKSSTPYYAKGFGDLKRVTYENLKSDFEIYLPGINTEQRSLIFSHLKTGKKRGKTRTIVLFSGLGVFAIGGILFAAGEGNAGSDPLVNTGGDKGQQLTGLLISGIGLSCSITSFFLPKAEKSYLEAIRVYNRHY